MIFKEGKEFDNLEKYVPKCCQEVMYMGTTDQGIDMYKHCDTRQYINIDDDGNFYIYTNEGYSKTDIVTAIDLLLQ